MNATNKRKLDNTGSPTQKRQKRDCSYSHNCFRKNPAHFREFSHPHLESILDCQSGNGSYSIPENLKIRKVLIEEQLKILIDNKIYEPNTGKETNSNKEKKTDSSSANTSTKDRNNIGNSKKENSDTNTTACKEDRIKNRVETGSETNSNKEKKIDSSSANTSLKDRNSIGNSKKEKSDANTTPCKVDTIRADRVGGKLNLKMEGNVKDEQISSDSGASYKNNPDYVPMCPSRRRIEDYISVVNPPGMMLSKHIASAPYHIFYTTIAASKVTHHQPDSITFQELLDPSLGELKCSLQLNFMVEIGWLLAHYSFAGYSNKKLTILYGQDMPDIKDINSKRPNVEAHKINMSTPFGTHHTKLSLLCYEDGSLRVVISTANLYADDWENRTQALWLSSSCPQLPSGSAVTRGESPTGFKRSLIDYLSWYRHPSLSVYVDAVKKCDFSEVNVFLVASVPGSHAEDAWGMTRVSRLLTQHCDAGVGHDWPLIAQSSSIGSYGQYPHLWLTGDFLTNFTKTKNKGMLLTSNKPKIKIIYPSLENVQRSHDGLLGGGCLPYGGEAHAKQTWLNHYMHQWKATTSGRDRAMPHIKSYLRHSPDCRKIAYFLLTSANISKAAWGTVNKGNGALRLMSYECGVLFLPEFVVNSKYFDLNGPGAINICYDLPPTPFEDNMTPWVMDYLR